jgi:hypothetical protein
LIGQMLAGADDGETFVVEQALDFKDGLDVLATIEAMAAGTFQGLERGEFEEDKVPGWGYRAAQEKQFHVKDSWHGGDCHVKKPARRVD